MNKSWKKLVAITSVIAMMSVLFVGCGEKETSSQESSKSSDKVQESSSAPAASSSEEPAKEVFTYPMTDCPEWTTLTVCTNGVKAVYGESDLNLTEWAKEVKARTGANVTFERLAVWDDASVNLLLTEQSYPDVVERYFQEKIDVTLAEDGVCIPLDDLIAEYMPNLTALMEEYPQIRMDITESDGHIYGFPAIKLSAMEGKTQGHIAQGLIIRSDWLEECGLNMPTTIDELGDVLRAFKEKYNATVVSGNAWYNTGTFRDAFEANGNFAYDENGEVYYTLTSDGYRDMMATIADWYEEGLFHKDFNTFNTTQVKTAALAGETGCFQGYGGSIMTAILQEADAAGIEMELAAVPALAAEKGGTVKYNCNQKPITADASCIITNNCDPELYPYICRYYDYLYSEEGTILGNFGIEGKSYEAGVVGEHGEPVYTEFMIHNPEGLTIDNTMAMYCRNHSNGYVGIQDYKYLYQYYAAYPAAVDAIEVWSFENREDSKRNIVEGYANYYTEDETELVAEINADLNTYVSEMRAKFIYGEADIHDDAVWEEYCLQTRKLRANELVDIVENSMNKKKAAYAEYGLELQ